MAGPWQTATVVSIRDETARAKTFRFALDEPVDHRAGQHYVVRLTAPDGYTASRSYSVASAPDGSDEIELTVERLDGRRGLDVPARGRRGRRRARGARPDRRLVRVGRATPAVLVGGGSGVVPLMAMLRLARA